MAELKACEFRKVRPLAGDPNGRQAFVCQAANFAHLAVVDGDLSPMQAICGRCTIPDLIANDRWACLFLRPIKMLDEGDETAYFACRWFYRIQRHGQPTDLSFCHGCPYWFPRPPLEMIHGHHEETEAIRRFIREGPPPPRWKRTWEQPPPIPWWRRILAWLV